ncbi:glycosyltransferase [Pseudoduganella sp. GCM10020061]|uniref:glycosyltransferase n=1 Tax=Pseudoduganella sp. GCM10020061 TaxID=3317345 RepID=UPI003630A34F
MDKVPLVAHLIYRLDFGGLETLLVERINRMPASSYRHAVLCLAGHDPRFAARIARAGVEVIDLGKRPGWSLQTHVGVWLALRRMRPAILHTYNLAAVEYALAGFLAGVPIRVNGAHGRDASDPDGVNRVHNWLRRLMAPFYDCCYANSAAMLEWLRATVRVPRHKTRLLANGIDTERFTPPPAIDPGGPIVIGTVGRIDAVKDHTTLMHAFVLLRGRLPELSERLQLAIVGDGPQLATLRALAVSEGIAHCSWLPGSRTDIPALLRGWRVFANSSIAEGMPASVLEAMACALPVVATRVGGIGEAVDDGETGRLVPPSDPQALADALEDYVRNPALGRWHGAAGREKVVRSHGMAAMVAAYEAMYDALCERKLGYVRSVKSCVE